MVKQGKERIMITVTEEQARTYNEIAEKLGITRSAFIQLATAQYVQAYNMTNGLSADIVKLASQMQELLQDTFREYEEKKHVKNNN